jgi:hypothetical protein
MNRTKQTQYGWLRSTAVLPLWKWHCHLWLVLECDTNKAKHRHTSLLLLSQLLVDVCNISNWRHASSTGKQLPVLWWTVLSSYSVTNSPLFFDWTLKMKTICSFETCLIVHQLIPRDNQTDLSLQHYRCENLNSGPIVNKRLPNAFKYPCIDVPSLYYMFRRAKGAILREPSWSCWNCCSMSWELK